MFDTRAVRDSFGRAARHYDAHAGLQRAARARLLALAKPFWPRGSLILDAGCGTGAFSEEAAQSGLGWKTVALDIAPGMCAIARMHCPQVANADVQEIPLADACVDGVFSSLMLQWVNRPDRALSEMARVLKPGAHAVLSTFADGTLKELAHAFRSVDDQPHVSDFIAPHRLLKLAADAGFVLAAAQQAEVVEHYPDTVALMRRLQAIGATNHHARRRKGLMTSRQFAALEQAYRCHYASSRGLPATWQVLMLAVRRR